LLALEFGEGRLLEDVVAERADLEPDYSLAGALIAEPGLVGGLGSGEDRSR
jgi:hypothetical protein